jgi:hypothetical protein
MLRNEDKVWIGSNWLTEYSSVTGFINTNEVQDFKKKKNRSFIHQQSNYQPFKEKPSTSQEAG